MANISIEKCRACGGKGTVVRDHDRTPAQLRLIELGEILIGADSAEAIQRAAEEIARLTPIRMRREG